MACRIVKLYDTILRKLIIKYLEKNSVLSEKQHEFRCGLSTLAFFLTRFDQIYSGFIVKRYTVSSYLAFAKAFDKVDHQLLLLKL